MSAWQDYDPETMSVVDWIQGDGQGIVPMEVDDDGGGGFDVVTLGMCDIIARTTGRDEECENFARLFAASSWLLVGAVAVLNGEEERGRAILRAGVKRAGEERLLR
jgi:hypothetical protein